MDTPRAGAVLTRGLNLVGGWVLDEERRVLEVQIAVNGYIQLVISDFHERADIEQRFPGVPGADLPGWTAELDLENLLPDRATVSAHAILEPLGGRGARRTALRRFASAACRLESSRGFRGGGRLLAPTWLPDGYQRICGLADAPGGVSSIDISVDGVPVGRARPALPGRLRSDASRLESTAATFESVVELPSSADFTSIRATVHPLEEPAFDLAEATVQVRHETDANPIALRTRRAQQRFDTRVENTRRTAPPPQTGEVRVLVVTHDLGLGGGQLYLQELLRRLHRRGLHAAVSTARGGVLVDELEDLGFPVMVSGAVDVRDPDSYEADVLGIATFAAENSCNVALGNTLLAFAGLDAAHRAGLATAWAIHESWPLDQFWMEVYGDSRMHGFVAGRARKTLGSCARPVFVAEATRRLYDPLLTSGASRVVPYGVDTAEIDAYRAHHDRDQLRRRLGFSDSTRVFLCLGTVEPRKAQLALAQAFLGSERLSGCDACLVVVGAVKGSAYVECLERLVADFGNGRVRVEPMQPDTYQWYHSADVFVCASDIESLPRSILEAMAFQRPILSTRVFGVPELIVDGSTGYLCRTRDVGALRTMLERASVTDGDDLRAMGRNASDQVRTSRDPRVYEDFFFDELSRLAGHPETTAQR